MLFDFGVKSDRHVLVYYKCQKIRVMHKALWEKEKVVISLTTGLQGVLAKIRKKVKSWEKTTTNGSEKKRNEVKRDKQSC